MQNDKTHPKISCDSCGKEIKQPQDGIIRWKWLPREGRLDCRSFAIVHRGECDDRLGYPSGSGFHHIEHVQEMFDYFVDSQVRAIKQGHCLVDCEGLAEVFNRVNPRRSYEKLYRLFHQAQRSAEARLNRHIQSIHGRVREITSTLIEIRFHKLHPSAFEATLVDVRNLLLTKFGPSSPMIEQMAVLEKQLAALPSDFRLEDKCDMLEKFISAIAEYASSDTAVREFKALLGSQPSVAPSRYERTSFLYWTERFWRWKPVSSAIAWVKAHRLVSKVVGAVVLLAAILTIVGWAMEWIG